MFVGIFVFSIPDADGANLCSMTNPNEFIMKSADPRICERTNYWVHYECGRIEGLYLTDPRCQPPPDFPTERLETTGSFIDLNIDKKTYKMGDTIHVTGTAYTSVGLPDDKVELRIIDSKGQKILDHQYKIDQYGKFGFEIQTGSTITINEQDNYELHLINYGQYGSSAFKAFALSYDGLPIKEPEPIIANTQTTPVQNIQVSPTPTTTPKPEPFNNWTMIAGVAIVIVATVIMIYRKIINSDTSIVKNYSRDETFHHTKESEKSYNGNTVDEDDPVYPTYQDVRNNFQRYSAEMLEDLVVKLFKAKGFDARKKGKTNESDGGIDVIANYQGNEVFIQVKHYGNSGNPVSSPSVRDFYGAITNVTHRGIFITTSTFTKDSLSFANDPSRSKFIELWDAEKFQNEIRRYLLEQEHSDFESVKDESNYYEILGSERTDSQEEIKRKYRELTLRFHPDKAKSSLSEKNMRLVNQAYDTLSDPEKRRQYDKELDS